MEQGRPLVAESGSQFGMDVFVVEDPKSVDIMEISDFAFAKRAQFLVWACNSASSPLPGAVRLTNPTVV